MAAIQGHAAAIKTEILNKALTHPDTKVQIFAAKELAARTSIPIEEIKKMKDIEGTHEVLQVYFLKAISAGQKFMPKEVRDALNPTGFGISLLRRRA